MGERIGLEYYRRDLRFLKAMPDSSELVNAELMQRLFEGLLPVEENEADVDFPELHSRTPDGVLLKGSVCLFTGEPGSGRHTAAHVFAKTAMTWVESNLGQGGDSEEEYALFGSQPQQEPELRVEDYFSFYSLDLELLKLQYGIPYSEVIRELSESLSAYCRREENEGTVMFLMFENVEKVLRKRKTALPFRYLIRQLMSYTAVTVVAAVVYEGRAEEIRDEYKSGMVVYECELPDTRQRLEFLQRFTARYVNIHLRYSPEDMCHFTEDFNYTQMSRLRAMLIMVAKGRAAHNDYRVGHLLSEEPQERRIDVYPNEIEQVCELVNCDRYREPVPAVQQNMVLPAGFPMQTAVYKEESPRTEDVLQEKKEEGPIHRTFGEVMKTIGNAPSVELPRMFRDTPNGSYQPEVRRLKDVLSPETTEGEISLLEDE